MSTIITNNTVVWFYRTFFTFSHVLKGNYRSLSCLKTTVELPCPSYRINTYCLNYEKAQKNISCAFSYKYRGEKLITTNQQRPFCSFLQRHLPLQVRFFRTILYASNQNLLVTSPLSIQLV